MYLSEFVNGRKDGTKKTISVSRRRNYMNIAWESPGIALNKYFTYSQMKRRPLGLNPSSVLTELGTSDL